MTLAPGDRELQRQLDREALAQRIADSILQSLDLKDILAKAVAEVRSLLEVERVMVYQFCEDGSGTVVAEALQGDRLSAMQGLHFPADDIPGWVRDRLSCDRVRSVIDVDSGKIGFSAARSGSTLASQEIQYRIADACHVQYLQTMGVKSSVVVPILCRPPQLAIAEAAPTLELWGLLVCHCDRPHAVSSWEIETLQTTADQIAIAIIQSGLLGEMRERAQIQAAANRLNEMLYAGSTLQPQPALEAIVAAMGATGGKLSLATLYDRETYTSGIQPATIEVWEHYVHCPILPEALTVDPLVIPDIQQAPQLQPFHQAFAAAGIHSLLVLPLYHQRSVLGQLILYGGEAVAETVWAGQIDPSQPQTKPRASFAPWREYRSTCRVWTDGEVKLAKALGEQCAAAIAQYRLYAQIELQVQYRTTELQRQAEQLQRAMERLQNTQANLIQAEKMSSLGQVVAGVAHQINNPVNFIYGNLVHANNHTQDLLALLGLYRKHFPDPGDEISRFTEEIDFNFLMGDMPKLLESMQAGAERIRQIVLGLRSFSRLDEADMKRVNIHDGLNSTLMILNHRLKGNATASTIQVVKNYGDLPPVECYASRMNQVFMNLLNNAVDALNDRPDPRIITITTTWDGGDRIQIAIQDNGCGIPETVRPHIFDPFFTTKPVGRGTGLGLSISYQIIENHSGTLDCTSEVGAGTTFCISIPVRQQPVKGET
ncbi:MAG: GAF domain-containing protein [Coleofasciculaceae cyanobacterium SM2_3_26]|nr:GAF domain-containing protein [Coleofasciculaceae cyanobacterium SM2_3_26]